MCHGVAVTFELFVVQVLYEKELRAKSSSNDVQAMRMALTPGWATISSVMTLHWLASGMYVLPLTSATQRSALSRHSGNL